MVVPEESAADEARGADNEKIFRDTNESIRAVVSAAPGVLPVVPFICECSDASCRELVRLTLADYAAVRESPQRFLVARGHEDRFGSDTTVVETYSEHAIVEKTGLEGARDG